jgi:hypothetical protein
MSLIIDCLYQCGKHDQGAMLTSEVNANRTRTLQQQQVGKQPQGLARNIASSSQNSMPYWLLSSQKMLTVASVAKISR